MIRHQVHTRSHLYRPSRLVADPALWRVSTCTPGTKPSRSNVPMRCCRACMHGQVEEKQVQPDLTTIIFWADSGYIAATRVLCWPFIPKSITHARLETHACTSHFACTLHALCTHARLHALCTHARLHARTHARMHARTHAHTHARTHARTHTPARTHQ